MNKVVELSSSDVVLTNLGKYIIYVKYRERRGMECYGMKYYYPDTIYDWF